MWTEDALNGRGARTLFPPGRTDAGGHAQRPSRLRRLPHLLLLISALTILPAILSASAEEQDDTAIRLADMLRSARTIISENQDLINDPALGDKGLTGDKVLAEAVALYTERTGEDPLTSDPESNKGRLLRAQMDAIREVVAENQDSINAEGVGFKGFIPAVFARLVNERFGELVGEQARVKVTAPEHLVRNRTARPDEWETMVIAEKFNSAEWPTGKSFSEITTLEGKPAFRFLVPEYYNASCLACHGEVKGELDVTGYPKEGGKEGELGAAISVTLFQ